MNKFYFKIFSSNKKPNLIRGFTPTPSFVSLRSVLDIFLGKFKDGKKSFSKTFINSTTKTQHKTWCRGFTLVELMVATSIFVLIMVTAMGSLIASNATSKKANQLRIAMDNVNFAVESMTRNLRIGTGYICGNTGVAYDSYTNVTADCDFATGSGSEFIAFTPSANMNVNPPSPIVAYRRYQNADGHYSLQRLDLSHQTGIDITSPDVNITYLKFFVIGADNAPTATYQNTQPSVYILMKGTVTAEGESVSFAIQTMASQRSSE